jgi:hypothetical protein
MGDSPGTHGILLGASPTVVGASNIRHAYGQPAAGSLFSAGTGQPVSQPLSAEHFTHRGASVGRRDLGQGALELRPQAVTASSLMIQS